MSPSHLMFKTTVCAVFRTAFNTIPSRLSGTAWSSLAEPRPRHLPTVLSAVTAVSLLGPSSFNSVTKEGVQKALRKQKVRSWLRCVHQLGESTFTSCIGSPWWPGTGRKQIIQCSEAGWNPRSVLPRAVTCQGQATG